MRIADDNNFFLPKYSPDFLAYEIAPGMHEVNEIDNASENLIKANVSIETITMKSRLKTMFLRFTEKSFFNTLLGIIPKWDYKSDTDFAGRNKLIIPIDRVHLRCDCIVGANMNGSRENILYSFPLDEPPRFKIFREP